MHLPQRTQSAQRNSKKDDRHHSAEPAAPGRLDAKRMPARDFLKTYNLKLTTINFSIRIFPRNTAPGSPTQFDTPQTAQSRASLRTP